MNENDSKQQTINKDKLPELQKKQDICSSSGQQSHQSPDKDGNLLPLTHKKRKRKLKKKVKKHSPQHYEQLKQKKQNRLLQKGWDSHFINEQIPDLYKKKRFKRKSLSKLKEKRSSTAVQSQKQIISKTTNLNFKKKLYQLPKLQKVSKRAKSFNIHLVTQKRQQKHELKGDNKTQKKLKQGASKQVLLEQYKLKIDQISEQVKLLSSHKQILYQFLQYIQRKSIQNMLDKQLDNIKAKKALISNVMTTISNRQALLSKIKQTKIIKAQNSNEIQKQALELIDNYRTSTLAVIEEILKWKQNWQALYTKVFNKVKILDLVYNAQNYLLTIMTSTDDVLARFVKDNPPKISNTENKINSQDKKPQDNKEPKPQPTNQQKEKQKQASEKKLEQSPKKPQVSANKSKDQPSITSKDPFLISIHNLSKQDNNIILKIRACQLLLLQQQFNFLKK